MTEIHRQWQTAAEDFLLDLRGSKEEDTERFYRSRIKMLVVWAVSQDIPLDEFRARHMRQYMAYRAEEIGDPPQPRVSEHTRHHDAISGRVFFRFCLKEGYTSVDALKEYAIPRAPRSYVKCPSAEELEKLLKAIISIRDVRVNPNARSTDAKQRTFWRVRDYAIVCMLIETGMRIGEVLALELRDYQPEEKRLVIRESKTDTSRIIPMTPALEQPLSVWLRTRPKLETQRLFVNMYGDEMSQNGFAKQFRSYLQYAGLERFTRHGVRHFTLTAMVGKNPRSAQLLAGHKDINTTMRYDHTSLEKVRADHAEVSPLGKILVHKRTTTVKKRVI